MRCLTYSYSVRHRPFVMQRKKERKKENVSFLFCDKTYSSLARTALV